MVNLFSIPTGVPFLPALRDRLLDGTLVGPLGPDDLARATIFLPTRRAVRAFAALLAEGRATLLPRIVPLGDADEEGADLGTALPPAIPPLERRLILTRLVQAWAEAAGREARESGTPRVLPDRPADAIGLAADLEGLMDAIETEGARWSDLAGLVEAEHSAYFAKTLEFVRIAHEVWPSLLAARGASDPARRRNAALAAETARLAAAPPDGPVIAAGSTGSVPATARLLGAIANLPRGAVVLPGLDLDLDEAGWTAIGGRERDGAQHGHPQFLLRRLLGDHLGLDRSAVRALGPGDGRSGRRRLLSAAMRPAETTDQWATLAPGERAGLAADGLDGVAILEAADEREEALAVAIAIREVLERPGATAILVTPHRGLAERVAAELDRWSIAAFDSAGRPLSETPAGRLARLAADVAASECAPVPVLALLSHPACRLGLPPAQRSRAVAALELGLLRGPAPRPGFAGLRAAFDLRRAEGGPRVAEPRRRLAPADWDAASLLLDRLDEAFAPFRGAEGGRLDLVTLAGRHRDAMAAILHASDRGEGGDRAPDPSEAALLRLFDELDLARVEDGAGNGLLGRLSEYPAFFAALARTVALAPERADAHPRVQILGLLEARLLNADRVILGGLDETVWPPSAVTDAFLSRPMRLALGLTPPERRVGQTAHDFVQALGHPDALVTRARKRDGKPTVPSRFLERLRAFVGREPWEAALARGGRYGALASRLDAPVPVRPASRPEPRPGGTRFPRALSVTEIETLVRDPYSIYARRILRLEPLEAVGVLPGAADRGTLIHDALADFAGACPDAIGPDADALLEGFGRQRFAGLADAYPELHALWWPAFLRLVPAYLAWERTRRRDGLALHVERSGELVIPLGPDDAFRLRARADRIEIGPDGAAAIVDYKTGGVPTDDVVAVGFSPQLTLEAAMLAEGGFRGVPAVTGLPDLDYVKIGGRAVLVTRRLRPPKKDTRSMAAIVDAHRRGLEATVRRFVSGEAAYVSRPYVQYARRYAPYDHLARVKEWSVLAAEGEGW